MAACHRCGAEVGSARFCTNCGSDLASAPPAMPAPPPGYAPPPPVATPPPTTMGNGMDTRAAGAGRDTLGRKKILLIAAVCAVVALTGAAVVAIAVTTGTDDQSAQAVPVSAAATAPGTSTPATSAPGTTSAGGGPSPTPGTLVTLGGRPGSAVATSRTSATGPVHSITPQSATASSTAPSSVDDAGVTTTYDPRNAIDGNPATAWRPAEGDGVGQELVLTLPAATTVTSVGLVPGYAKTDPSTGVDRFAQNRTIARVSWTFDDGTSVQQDLRADRTMQTVPVSAITSTVRLKILQTRAPAAAADPRNFAPISEVSLSGAS